MVIADRMGQRGHAIARYFSEAMGLGHIKMVHEANFLLGKPAQSICCSSACPINRKR